MYQHLSMSAIQPKKQTSSTKSLVIVGGVIGIVAIALIAYLMWYTASDELVEVVKVIAVTEQGCVVETFDGYAFTIEKCDAEPGQVFNTPIDQKVKERALLMNPTS